MLQISRSETSLKRDSGTGIFLWIFHNFSIHLIYRTPPDDYSCWFLCSNQPTKLYSLMILCSFFPSFFYFIIDKLHGSLLRKHLKMKILFFTIVFYFLRKCGHDNFAPTIICRCWLKKIQISFGKNLGNCWQPRQISKAALVLM